MFSHCIDDGLTVREVLRDGFQHHLRPRLSSAAGAEKLILYDCLEHLELTDQPDARFLHSNRNVPFSSRGAYHVIQGEALAADASTIWTTRLPTKVKFFAWLLSLGRLNTRAYLHHRNITPLDDSWCAHCPGVLETAVHIFSECHRARQVWARLGIPVPGDLVHRPWDVGSGIPLPYVVRLDIVLLLLWHLWKARNSMVFDHVDSSPCDIVNRVCRDIDAWRFRD